MAADDDGDGAANGAGALANPWAPAASVGAGAAAEPSAALLLRLQPAAPGARLLPDGALQLQAARMVEAVVAAEVGAANVRRWLLVSD